MNQGQQHNRIHPPLCVVEGRLLQAVVLWIGAVCVGLALGTSCCFGLLHADPSGYVLYQGPSWTLATLLGLACFFYTAYLAARFGERWVAVVVTVAVFSAASWGWSRGVFEVVMWELEQSCHHGDVGACAELGYHIAPDAPEEGCRMLAEACLERELGTHRSEARCLDLDVLGCVDEGFCAVVRNTTSGPCSTSEPLWACDLYDAPCRALP
ncbi:MAG: hypothetical protein AAFX99_26490 [Myxococcota bacterium]